MIELDRAVHPVAALFPMMADGELDELAADIRANGLRLPVVVDADGTLIDGRNRIEACRRASVEPRYEVLSDGLDPVAYIISTNVIRRHLSKGQAAMAAAKALLVSNTPQTEAARVAGLHRTRVVQAAVVIEHAPELADRVLTGAASLDDAYRTAQDRKRAAEQTEVQLTTLRAEAPDLADLVVEEQISLADALAAHRERERTDREYREVATRTVATGLYSIWTHVGGNVEASRDRPFTATWLAKANPYRERSDVADLFTSAGIRGIARLLNQVADELDQRSGGVLGMERLL
jgi:ParB-like chromosome segregation protein Spo0J